MRVRSAHRPAEHVHRASCAIALAPHRGPRLRLDLDLGPLLRRRRHRATRTASRRSRATPRSPRPRRACALRQPRVLGRATGIPRCSRTRWRRSTSSPTGASPSGSAAGGWRRSTRRTASTFPPCRHPAAPGRRGDPVRARAAHRRTSRASTASTSRSPTRCCEPKPVQDRLPLWIGGGGEKVTLRIAAEHADGWNVPFISPEDFARKVGVLGEHCDAVGRDPGEIDEVGERRHRDRATATSRRSSARSPSYVRPGVLHRQRRARSSTASARTATPAPSGSSSRCARRSTSTVSTASPPRCSRSSRERAASYDRADRASGSRSSARPPGPSEPRAGPTTRRARSASAGSRRPSRTRCARSRTGGRRSRPATRSTSTRALGRRRPASSRCPARGAAEVVLYSPDHDGSLATHRRRRARAVVVDLWAERTAALLDAARDRVRPRVREPRRRRRRDDPAPARADLRRSRSSRRSPRREAAVAAAHGCPVCARRAGRGRRRRAASCTTAAAGSRHVPFAVRVPVRRRSSRRARTSTASPRSTTPVATGSPPRSSTSWPLRPPLRRASCRTSCGCTTACTCTCTSRRAPRPPDVAALRRVGRGRRGMLVQPGRAGEPRRSCSRDA